MTKCFSVCTPPDQTAFSTRQRCQLWNLSKRPVDSHVHSWYTLNLCRRRLTFELTRGRKPPKAAVGLRVQRWVRPHDCSEERGKRRQGTRELHQVPPNCARCGRA